MSGTIELSLTTTDKVTIEVYRIVSFTPWPEGCEISLLGGEVVKVLNKFDSVHQYKYKSKFKDVNQGDEGQILKKSFPEIRKNYLKEMGFKDCGRVTAVGRDKLRETVSRYDF